MQMPGNYPKARRVEAHRMKIEQAGRGKERERRGRREINPNSGFTCLVMQDDWGVWGGLPVRCQAKKEGK